MRRSGAPSRGTDRGRDPPRALGSHPGERRRKAPPGSETNQEPALADTALTGLTGALIENTTQLSALCTEVLRISAATFSQVKPAAAVRNGARAQCAKSPQPMSNRAAKIARHHAKYGHNGHSHKGRGLGKKKKAAGHAVPRRSAPAPRDDHYQKRVRQHQPHQQQHHHRGAGRDDPSQAGARDRARHSDGNITLFMRVPMNPTKQFRVRHDSDVLVLRKAVAPFIRDAYKCPTLDLLRMRLMFAGSVLEDGLTVTQYNLHDRDTISCAVAWLGGAAGEESTLMLPATVSGADLAALRTFLEIANVIPESAFEHPGDWQALLETGAFPATDLMDADQSVQIDIRLTPPVHAVDERGKEWWPPTMLLSQGPVMTEGSLSIRVGRDMRVAQLREYLASATNIPAAFMTLSYLSVLMQDSLRVFAYGVIDGGTLILQPHQEGWAMSELFARIPDQVGFHTVQIPLTAPVHLLFKKVAKHMNCRPRDLSIMFSGRPLSFNRGRNLNHYNLTRHSIINVNFLIHAGADTPEITLHTETLSRGMGDSWMENQMAATLQSAFDHDTAGLYQRFFDHHPEHVGPNLTPDERSWISREQKALYQAKLAAHYCAIMASPRWERQERLKALMSEAKAFRARGGDSSGPAFLKSLVPAAPSAANTSAPRLLELSDALARKTSATSTSAYSLVRTGVGGKSALRQREDAVSESAAPAKRKSSDKRQAVRTSQDLAAAASLSDLAASTTVASSSPKAVRDPTVEAGTVRPASRPCLNGKIRPRCGCPNCKHNRRVASDFAAKDYAARSGPPCQKPRCANHTKYPSENHGIVDTHCLTCRTHTVFAARAAKLAAAFENDALQAARRREARLQAQRPPIPSFAGATETLDRRQNVLFTGTSPPNTYVLLTNGDTEVQRRLPNGYTINTFYMTQAQRTTANVRAAQLDSEAVQAEKRLYLARNPSVLFWPFGEDWYKNGPPRVADMCVYVEGAAVGNKTRVIEANGFDSGAELLHNLDVMMIGSRSYMYPGTYYVIFGGRRLDTERSLFAQGISGGAALLALPRVRGGGPPVGDSLPPIVIRIMGTVTGCNCWEVRLSRDMPFGRLANFIERTSLAAGSFRAQAPFAITIGTDTFTSVPGTEDSIPYLVSVAIAGLEHDGVMTVDYLVRRAPVAGALSAHHDTALADARAA